MSEDLRDRLAEALHGQIGSVVELDVCESAADALLSGPLAPLLAAQAAVERVEALCDAWSEYPASPEAARASELRRALDGTP